MVPVCPAPHPASCREKFLKGCGETSFKKFPRRFPPVAFGMRDGSGVPGTASCLLSGKVLEGVRGNFFQEVSPAFSSCGFWDAGWFRCPVPHPASCRKKFLKGCGETSFKKFPRRSPPVAFGMRDGSGVRRGFSDVLLLGKPLEVCRHILIVVGCRNAAAVPHRIICPEGFLYPVQFLFPHSGGGQGSGIGTFP